MQGHFRNPLKAKYQILYWVFETLSPQKIHVKFKRSTFLGFLHQMSEAICIPAMDSMNMIDHLAGFVTRPMTNWAVIMSISSGFIPVRPMGTYCAALAVKHDDFVNNKQLLLVF